jgi:hypothetical protein
MPRARRPAAPAHEIPPLDPEELAKIGARMYGARSWRTPLGRSIGYSQPSVSLWALGKVPIPMRASIAVRRLYAEHRAKRAQARVLEGK